MAARTMRALPALPWVDTGLESQPQAEVEVTLLQTPATLPQTRDRSTATAAQSWSLSSTSQRLHRHWQDANYCDCSFQVDASTELVRAHRVVLSRNPHMSMSAAETILLPAGVSSEGLHAVLLAHYLEDERGQGSDAARTSHAASQVLQELRAKLSCTEWSLLDQVFGPLNPERWHSLSDTLRDDARFCDCRLQLDDGSYRLGHRVMLACPDSNDYIASALSWPGADQDAAVQSLQLPPDLSSAALDTLLSLRYCRRPADAEYLLECIHFADFLGWGDVMETIHEQLLEILERQKDIDADSAVAVFTYCANSSYAASLPKKLRQLSYSAALRWFIAASDEAKSSLSVETRVRLQLLSKIRNRFGHVVEDIQDYLHAAGDDLLEWEMGLGPEAPPSARIALDNQWEHWKALVAELARLDGSMQSSEAWRSRILERRCAAQKLVKV